MATGLFVGLITLDLIYLTPRLPQSNQKLVASNYTIAAGGPATNAAIAFQSFGHIGRLMGVVGTHPISQLVLADLQQWAIEVIDLDPSQTAPLPTSSILVTEATGDRAVISINATRTQAAPDRIPNQTLAEIEIVLIDGHQMAIGQEIARQANQQGIPIVVDGGSWKTGFETVLCQADYVICSANFRPPACETVDDVFDYLQELGVTRIAISQGAQPLLFREGTATGKIPVPQVTPVDTLGAGDVLHGAFCHFILQTDFQTALAEAAIVASRACQQFGTRSWMQAL